MLYIKNFSAFLVVSSILSMLSSVLFLYFILCLLVCVFFNFI